MCDVNATYRKWRQCDLQEVTSMWPTGSDVNVPGGELPGRHPVLLSVEDVGAAAWAGAGGRRRRHRRTRGQRARGDLLRARHGVHARQALHPLPLNKNKNWFNLLQRKFYKCIPFLGIARPQSQFPHSCVCERFTYSHDRSTYFPAAA